MTHFAAPHDQLEVDRAFAESRQENAGRGMLQDVRIALAGGDERFAHFLDVAAVGDANRHAEPHSRIAVSPVRHRRIDKLRVRHDHRDVVIGQDGGAPGANLLHLPDDTGHLDAIAYGDRSLGEDHQPADEIARDILQPKPDANADGARENSQRSEMNSRVLEHNENANDENEVADDLRDRVLKGAVEPAFDEEAIEEKTLGSRREPKNCDEKRDEEKQLHQTERDARDWGRPEERNAGGVDGVNGKENDGGSAQDRGDDRGKIRVELKAGEKAPYRLALETGGNEQPDSKERGKRHQPQKRDVMAANVKKRPLKEGEVHGFSLGWLSASATGNVLVVGRDAVELTKIGRAHV